MSKMNVKTGDTVIVISGEGRKQKDKPAKKGKVQKVFPETGRIIVEGVNIVKKHQNIISHNLFVCLRNNFLRR